MLSKAWFQLSADMSYVCLRITPGLTEPIQESDVLALLRLSNCRRYEPLGEGIREAVTLLNALIAEPDAPAHPPVPIARRQDARLLIQVDKDQMSARAQITADWGGQPLTLTRLQEALAASTVKQGVSDRLLAAAIQAAGEAAPGAQLNPVIALGKAARHGLDTRLERLVETAAERILKPQERDHGKVDMRDLGTLLTVKAGALLMRRHPATQGIDGFTVTGQTLTARHGKESAMTPGDGTCLSPRIRTCCWRPARGSPVRSVPGCGSTRYSTSSRSTSATATSSSRDRCWSPGTSCPACASRPAGTW